MREILFRGKWINGLWVYGDLRQYSETRIGIYSYDLKQTVKGIIPETVGQYTGLTVPSGKIFEHDVVTAKFKSNGARFNFAVKYDNQKGCYIFDNGYIEVPFEQIRSVRILGNIHDNPELLKGE